ncbi:AI-2E family transporter [Aliagarivorans marinus]|uniref:AI-2E family transporter n=1 Tax=Aliagarivorans marinus TaxID=561965 RepID=UPI000425D725|nr:AI-2E family transporter [Aliagarivorans marinus]
MASFQKNAVEAAVRIALLFVLVAWCYDILKPFITPIVWAAFLSVALYPPYRRLRNSLGNASLAAVVIVLLGLMLLLIPGVQLASAVVSSVSHFAENLQEGDFALPAPYPAIRHWPFIGEWLFQQWALAAQDSQEFLLQHSERLADWAAVLLNLAGGVVASLFLFCFSFIVAGVLLANSERCKQLSQRFAERLLGHRGPAMIQLASDTIQSVAKGVLGVALIQTVLISIAFLAVGIPATALLSALVLVLAIAQLPPLLVVGPVIIYVFYTEPMWVAITFAVWGIVASFSEHVLKPWLLGRGVDVPMLVILLGAIGGLLMSGFVGLFIGAVVLAVSYQLVIAWLDDGLKQ